MVDIDEILLYKKTSSLEEKEITKGSVAAFTNLNEILENAKVVSQQFSGNLSGRLSKP